jgi:hypothetical protein
VNAKIIANGRVDTTQGIDMTKRLIATELTNAINATTPNSVSHFVHQSDFPFLSVSKGETVALRYRTRSMVPIKSRNRPVIALLVTALTKKIFVTTHHVSCNQNRIYHDFACSIYNQFTQDLFF